MESVGTSPLHRLDVATSGIAAETPTIEDGIAAQVKALLAMRRVRIFADNPLTWSEAFYRLHVPVHDQPASTDRLENPLADGDLLVWVCSDAYASEAAETYRVATEMLNPVSHILLIGPPAVRTVHDIPFDAPNGLFRWLRFLKLFGFRPSAQMFPHATLPIVLLYRTSGVIEEAHLAWFAKLVLSKNEELYEGKLVERLDRAESDQANLYAYRQELVLLRQQLRDTQAQLESLQQSTSWKVTRPLRWFIRALPKSFYGAVRAMLHRVGH